jgi:hypothetical protein
MEAKLLGLGIRVDHMCRHGDILTTSKQRVESLPERCQVRAVLSV